MKDVEIHNLKDALDSVTRKELKQRKVIKKLTLENKELAKQLNLAIEGELKDEPLCVPVLDFGDYGIIEQKRYGCENKQYTHKVIGQLRSNTWVDVPVQSPATETMHNEIVDVIRCVCCGVSETEVLKYKVEDVKPNGDIITK